MTRSLGSLPALADLAADRDAAALAVALARRTTVVEELAALDRLLREPAGEVLSAGIWGGTDTPLAGAAGERWQDWTAQRRRILDAALAGADRAVAEARERLRFSDGRRRAVEKLGERIADEERILRHRRLEAEGQPPE